jgi:hypothetical protein
MATFTTLASTAFLVSPPSAARFFGLPRHSSAVARPWIQVLGGRSLVVALSLWTFLYQEDLKAVGVLMMSATASAAIDAVICVREGERGRGLGHGIAGVGMAFAGWSLSRGK